MYICHWLPIATPACSFGMKHDGLNNCSMTSGDKSYIMFPEFLVDAGRPLIWSNCSRETITKFLE